MRQTYHAARVEASLFGRSFYREWKWIMVGSIITIAVEIQPYAFASGQVRPWLAALVMVITILWASFRVWRKEYRQAQELAEFRTQVYADIILAWLKKSAGTRLFSAGDAARSLGLPIEHVNVSIRWLHGERFLREAPGHTWEFRPTDAVLATPYFVRNPVLDQGYAANK